MRGIEIERLRIASAMLRGLRDFAETMGVDYDATANAVGLEPVNPDADDKYVHLDSFAKFLEIGSILAGDESFGLRFAASQQTVLSGPLSLAQLNAPTLRQSLLTMVKYISTRVDVAHVELVVESDRTIVEWDYSPLFVRRWQLIDFTAGALVARLQRILRKDWRPLGVGLVRPAPKDQELHRQVFGRSVEYSCRTNYISFPSSLLSVPIANADPVIYDISTRLLKRMLVEHQEAVDLLTSVREEIIQGLASGEGAQLARIARRMGMSIRTLQRSLAQHDTTYQELLDTTRKELAERYLEDPDLSFSQISYQLGFSAPSAFTRASYRWFGHRPGAVRKLLRRSLANHAKRQVR